MGVLADIYSGGNTLKRRVNALIKDPAGTLGLGVTRFGEDQNQLINLMRNAYPMAGEKTVLNSPQQVAQFRGELADKSADQVMAGMFVGQGSKTWDAIAASKAVQLERAGVDARKIWSETGTWKAPDGMWRQEIPDNMAKARDYQLTPSKAFSQARFNAAIEDSQPLRDRAESMLPYWQKSKTQLTDEYHSTGGEIVDAALSGDMDLAKRLQQGRGGLNAMLEEMSNATYGPSSSFLKHGDLGKAYPDVYNMHTRIDKDALSGSKGHYNRGNAHQGEQIVLGEKPTFSDGKSIQLHEMQHAIQQREGWARGGSPEGLGGALSNDARELRVAARELDSSAWRNDPFGPSELLKPGARKKALAMEKQAGEFDSWASRINEFGDGYANKAYLNLAGEAEARATQARIPLDAAQRRALFPADSYDVPLNQLIIRGMTGK